MNKKGFAISVILYSIILLIVAILYMLLGIMRVRYSTNSKLREQVVNELNNELTGNVFTSEETCTISGSSTNYVENLILTINVTNYGKSYKFNSGTWSSDNTILVDHAGSYVGYFRDTKGGEGNCRVDVISQTMYRYRDCLNSHYVFGPWYRLSDASPTGCVAVSQSYAESNYLSEYTVCTASAKTVYKRDFVRCDFSTETWSVWSATYPQIFYYRDVEAKTLYKIK